MSSAGYVGFLFQTAPTGVVAEPQEVTVSIGHLSRDADLVAVEVVDFLFAFAFSSGPVKVRSCRDRRRRYRYICRPVGLPARGGAVPNEVGAFRFGTRPGEFVLPFFGKASAERVVGVVDGATIRLPLI